MFLYRCDLLFPSFYFLSFSKWYAYDDSVHMYSDVHTNCLLSAASCICLPVSYCVMVLLLILFTPGLLSCMASVLYLSSVLLPYYFNIPGVALVANDEDAGKGPFLRPWTKNITIRNTASWSTEMSVYAASPRCPSMQPLLKVFAFLLPNMQFFPAKDVVHCLIQLSDYTNAFLYFLAASTPPEASVTLLQRFADAGQMSSSTMMVSASIFTYIELLAYIPDFQISIQQLSHFSLRNMPTSTAFYGSPITLMHSYTFWQHP